MEIHYLNVDEGDCSIVKHDSGRVSMIDICCGNIDEDVHSGTNVNESFMPKVADIGLSGNFRQKEHPDNPLKWLEKVTDKRVFRFVATHPDMDHLDGLKKLFASKFKPINFWDTDNDKTMDLEHWQGRYLKDDWEFYQELHGDKVDGVKCLKYHAGQKAVYFNADSDSDIGDGDRIEILSPNRKIVRDVGRSGNVNDLSYVLLMKTSFGRKILFCGDTEADAWNEILDRYEAEVQNIDILIPPHHGRASGGNDEYLDVLKPKITIFGNAKSQYLDYDSWNNRGLLHFTNNEIGSVIFSEKADGLFSVYGTYKNAVIKWHQKMTSSVFSERDLAVHPEFEGVLSWGHMRISEIEK